MALYSGSAFLIFLFLWPAIKIIDFIFSATECEIIFCRQYPTNVPSERRTS